MARQHIAAEPMHLTSQPAPSATSYPSPRYHYTIQLCRRCGCVLGGGDGIRGRFPVGAVVEEGDLYLAMVLHDRAVPECEAMK